MIDRITISSRGVVTIPARMRHVLGIGENDELIAEMTEQGILLRPAITIPLEIYTEERIAGFFSEDAALGQLLDGHKT